MGLYSLLYTEAPGNTILASRRNAEHQNHIDKMEPQYMNDYSASASVMRTTEDPGESGSESLATTLQGEITRKRHAILDTKQAIDPDISYWYETPKNASSPIINLGLTLSGGVFTITDAGGTALSSTNRGFVTVPSTTAGQKTTLEVIAGGTFNDDANASSSLTNIGFGITETVDWDQDVPFFLYVVNRANSSIDGSDGSSAFFISRNPCLTTTPASGDDIGDTGAAPVNDSEDIILILDDVTVANYTSLPCELIGAFRMRWSTSTDDWTVQTLGNSDGIGQDALDKTFSTVWTFPVAQNGAATSYHISQAGGTQVSWATPGNITYQYTISRDGWVDVIFSTANAGNCTNGTGTDQVSLHLPNAINSSFYSATGFRQIVGHYAANAAPSGADGILVGDFTTSSPYQVTLNDTFSSNLNGNDFSDANDDLFAQFKYKAF